MFTLFKACTSSKLLCMGHYGIVNDDALRLGITCGFVIVHIGLLLISC
jgi:hypothetical protein